MEVLPIMFSMVSRLVYRKSRASIRGSLKHYMLDSVSNQDTLVDTVYIVGHKNGLLLPFWASVTHDELQRPILQENAVLVKNNPYPSTSF